MHTIFCRHPGHFAIFAIVCLIAAHRACSAVSWEALDGLGESEVVDVHFRLKKLLPEDVETSMKNLLGPAASITCLPASQELSITDTAGRLRKIRDLLGRTPKPAPGLQLVHLKNIRAEDALPPLRQLLDIPEGKDAAADSSIRIVRVPSTNTLLISGRPDKVARAQSIVTELDGGDPQLEIYPLGDLGYCREQSRARAAKEHCHDRHQSFLVSLRPIRRGFGHLVGNHCRP